MSFTSCDMENSWTWNCSGGNLIFGFATCDPVITYTFTIYWGDGNVVTDTIYGNTTAKFSHMYLPGSAAYYNVTYDVEETLPEGSFMNSLKTTYPHESSGSFWRFQPNDTCGYYYGTEPPTPAPTSYSTSLPPSPPSTLSPPPPSSTSAANVTSLVFVAVVMVGALLGQMS